jgi:glucose-1-phosphate adenylyltransferase
MFDGYWTSINTIQTYYQSNLDFLRKDVRDIFLREPPFIESKPKDEAPAKFNATARTSNVITGSGSIINGEVINSVLFRKVVVGDNARVINSIIMEGSFIGPNCYVENAIFDKEVILCEGKSVVGTPEMPKIIEKNTLL